MAAGFDMTVVTVFLTKLTEPGAFIMEQEMVRCICDRTAREERPREPVGQH